MMKYLKSSLFLKKVTKQQQKNLKLIIITRKLFENFERFYQYTTKNSDKYNKSTEPFLFDLQQFQTLRI